jgi:uncharacterized membrane protein (UPF0127 family)
MASALKLFNKSSGQEIASQVRLAQGFWKRNNGLLGVSHLPKGHGLWIQGSWLVGCNSIHTFFMRFSIDAIFVDRELRVKSVYQDLRPWRATWPTTGAFSVFELPAGTLKEATVEIGDVLNVGN